MRIKPFQALRPPPAEVSRVAAPPYDVVTVEEARAIAADNPQCFLRVSRPELELPAGTDPYSGEVYRRAAANFELFQRRGYLVPDVEPALYVYRQVQGTHQQTGVVAVCHADDYDQDVIKKHEKTRQAPEDDRTRHLATVRAQTGPVFLTYRDQPEIDAAVAQWTGGPPLYDFQAPDGVRHMVWRVGVADRLQQLFARVPAAYIADGHHRAAAAARFAREQRQAHPGARGDEEYLWFLAVLFPAGQLRILPYNRVVCDLGRWNADDFLREVGRRFTVTADAEPQPAERGRISMYLGGRWYDLGWTPPVGADVVQALDVSALQDRLLAPLLDIADPRQSKRIQFVGGIRGVEALRAAVDAQGGGVAFSLYPVSVLDLLAIADLGRTMPPKSTWFEPKLRSGILVHAV